MGNSETVPLASPPSANEYFVLVFHFPDKLLTIYALPDVNSLIRQTILKQWSPGIRKEGPCNGDSHCFKFNKSPFVQSDENDQGKQMICEILANLRASGWQLIVSSELSRGEDLSSWFFRRIGVEMVKYPICSVSLLGSSKLQLINATDNLSQAIETALELSYPAGGKRCRDEECIVEFDLKDDPWHELSNCSVDAKKFLTKLIEEFEKRGYRHYAVARFGGGCATSFYLIKDEMIVPGEARFYAINLAGNNRIRLLNAPNSIEQIAEKTIQRVWTRGVKRVEDYKGAWECKLAGQPWCPIGAEESVDCRLLLCALFSEFLHAGWAIHCVFDASLNSFDKSVFIFRSCTGGERMRHTCLSLNGDNWIRLLNFPSGFDEISYEIFQQRYPSGIKSRKLEFYKGSVEYTLNGVPFSDATYGYDGLHFRALMCVLLKLLEENGFKVIASADVSGRSTNKGRPIDMHSWFVICT